MEKFQSIGHAILNRSGIIQVSNVMIMLIIYYSAIAKVVSIRKDQSYILLGYYWQFDHTSDRHTYKNN